MKKFFFLLLTSIMFFSCGKQNDEELFKSAEELKSRNQYQKAFEEYDKIAKDYPEGKHAPDALFNMAYFYQNKYLKNVPAEQSSENAVKLFREVYDKYPSYDKAPEALFYSGFILANELQEYKKATAAYKLFLEKFPKHELASSAQYELENMGKSPDDILNKKQKEVNI
ncbi:MAG TPA: tetratricopeptide repeat protein [Ignavibacteriaceae bacterium]|nr:tetratricopeptide repeat protein [Ignavibacteriaceae bacterium]